MNTMNPVEIILLLHAAATWTMVGLILFVQIVHYPLMAAVGGEQFQAYARSHLLRTGWVVAAPMLLEAGTVAVLPFLDLPAPDHTLVLVGAALLVGIWLSTALVQVPCHDRLQRGFDAAIHGRLVRSNWIRTVAWCLRGGLALLLLA